MMKLIKEIPNSIKKIIIIRALNNNNNNNNYIPIEIIVTKMSHLFKNIKERIQITRISY